MLSRLSGKPRQIRSSRWLENHCREPDSSTQYRIQGAIHFVSLYQLDCELFAEVGIAPVRTDLGEMEGDHPNAFVLDHHAMKRIDQRKEVITEYTNSEGFVLCNALPFHISEYTNDEGFVLRNAIPFHISEHSSNVVKRVRVGHVQTDKHWMYSSTKCNKLELDSNGKPPKLSAKDWLG